MRRFARFASMVLVLGAVTAPSAPVFARASSPADAAVALDSGKVTGLRSTIDPAVRIYLGVPFAAPPVGAWRWRPPQPPARWDGVRACDHIGPACPQPSSLMASTGGGGEAQSEDCLYLNLWTPATRADAKLPVMVWIHGGGFFLGSGSGSGYEGTPLARKQVILVAINYRLGPFGFLGHPELSKESEHGSSGNYGLLDQIAALSWVQRNIAAFGGDPTNVTIFGESAGAFSVSCLLASPLAKGLFHRAIAESGSAIWIHRHLKDRTLAEEAAEATGTRVLEQLVGSAHDVLATARAKSAEQLLAVAKPGLRLLEDSDTNAFGPSVDGWVIPDDPWKLFRDGKVNLVPTIMGTNANEGSVFVPRQTSTTADQYTQSIRTNYGLVADQLLALYSIERWHDVPTAQAEMLGDLTFIAPARAQARALADAGATCFLYHFTHVNEGPAHSLGAFHAAEIPYVFGHTDSPSAFVRFVAKDRELSATMMDYWVQFARSGNPNRDGLPKWAEYTTESDAHLALGDKIEMTSGLHANACDTWDAIMAGWHALRDR